MRVFHLQEYLKRKAKGITCNIQHIHVVGAGTMGGDIAAYCALKGFRVTLSDLSLDLIAKAIARAYQLFQKKLKRREDVTAAMDRLIPDVPGEGVTQADLIIEAISEKLEAKQGLFQMLETKAKAGAIFATNTSTIPLNEIRQNMHMPERLLGIHFFNPVAQMQLVEIVSDTLVQVEAVNQALVFVRKLDKLPVHVKSSPGFLVNRILMPYLQESMILIDEGVEKEIIDKAALEFGMPMGPITLADTVGLDICLSVSENLAKHFDKHVPMCLKDTVAHNDLGVKTGQGFYRYKNKKPICKPLKQVPFDQTIADRLILSMINEVIACLREGCGG